MSMYEKGTQDRIDYLESIGWGYYSVSGSFIWRKLDEAGKQIATERDEVWTNDLNKYEVRNE